MILIYTILLILLVIHIQQRIDGVGTQITRVLTCSLALGVSSQPVRASQTQVNPESGSTPCVIESYLGAGAFGQSQGFGIRGSKQTLVLTYHAAICGTNVVANCGHQGWAQVTEVVAADAMRDVVIVTCDRDIPKQHTFQWSKTGCRMGAEVRVLARSSDGHPHELAGAVVGYNYYRGVSRFEVDARVQEGDSGAPVVDAHGHLVGMVVSRGTRNGTPVAVVISVEELQNILGDHGNGEEQHWPEWLVNVSGGRSREYVGLVSEAQRIGATGDVREAEMRLLEAIRLLPRVPMAYDFLDGVLLQDKDAAHAETVYKQLISEQADVIMPRLYLGHTLFRRGKVADALSMYQSCRTMFQSPPWAIDHWIIACLLNLRRTDEAIVAFRSGLATNKAATDDLMLMFRLSAPDAHEDDRLWAAKRIIECDAASIADVFEVVASLDPASQTYQDGKRVIVASNAYFANRLAILESAGRQR